MGSARGSSSDPNWASDIARLPLSSLVQPVPPSGIAPVTRPRPLSPLSKSKARRSPGIPVPANIRDGQAGHLRHLPQPFPDAGVGGRPRPIPVQSSAPPASPWSSHGSGTPSTSTTGHPPCWTTPTSSAFTW